MLAKIMGRTIEIPENRVKGSVGGGAIKRDSPGAASYGVCARNSSKQVSNPAPSPLIFLLNHQIPSGKNAVKINRKGQRYPDKKFVIWRAKALEAIGGVAQAFPGPVHMIVDYVPGDNIRRDAPGMLDALCHLIEKAGIVADDKQVKSLVWREYPVQPKRARCSVSICDYQL